MTPIHVDKELTPEWWEAHGFVIGTDVFYNTIPNASDRYRGFILKGHSLVITSVKQALKSIT